MRKSSQDFFSKANEIIGLFEIFSKKNNLKSHIVVDHICYKCKSQKEYESIRKYFENESKYFYQTILSGRRISIINLKNTIKTKLGEIKFLELSDFELDEKIKGFHHIELVLKNISIKDFGKILAKENIEMVFGGAKHHRTHYFYLGKYKFKITELKISEIIKKEI